MIVDIQEFVDPVTREGVAIPHDVRFVHAAELLEQRFMSLVREIDRVVVSHAEDRQAQSVAAMPRPAEFLGVCTGDHPAESISNLRPRGCRQAIIIDSEVVA